MEIPLRNQAGEIVAHALIDDEDAHLAEQRWCRSKNGYVVRNRPKADGRGTIYLHREILGLPSGRAHQGDHKNHNKLDNRRSNLRIATAVENGQNRAYGYGRSAHRGVTWDKNRNRWVAFASLGGRYIFLGRFDDELGAANTAAAFRREHYSPPS